jgi:CHRD domain
LDRTAVLCNQPKESSNEDVDYSYGRYPGRVPDSGRGLDGDVEGRIPIVQGYAERRTTSAAGANSRHRAAELTYDPATRVLTWTLSYSGLSGPAAMAHFHGPAGQGKNGPPVIWLSPKGSPVQAPVKGEATLTPEQAQQFSAGEWYINVHTQDHQAGEIRGQVMPPKS